MRVAIVGGGIAGTSAAALLAERGAAVTLFERDRLAAAASGRNSGVIQHPFDVELAPLHRESVGLYEELSAAGAGFELPPGPPGLLMVADVAAAVREVAAVLRESAPELDATVIEADELARVEPSLAPGLTACRLATGVPVPPASATRAFGELARSRGAAIEEGVAARPWVEDGRVRGVTAGDRRVEADAVLVAAGPWTDGLVGSSITTAVWGVNVEVELPEPPSLPVEQVGVIGPEPGAADDELVSTFSIVTAAGASSVGSTFLTVEPDDPEAIAPLLLERGAAFVPALADAPIRSVRACARPASADGRPVVGPVPGVDGLYVATGHGMWGISIGPATARIAADLITGGDGAVPPAIDAARVLARH